MTAETGTWMPTDAELDYLRSVSELEEACDGLIRACEGVRMTPRMRRRVEGVTEWIDKLAKELVEHGS